MKAFFTLFFLPFVLCASEPLRLRKIERSPSEQILHISDSLKWSLISHEGGTTIDSWKIGDEVCYWHLPEYTAYEYRIFNLNHFGCYKARYIQQHR